MMLRFAFRSPYERRIAVSQRDGKGEREGRTGGGEGEGGGGGGGGKGDSCKKLRYSQRNPISLPRGSFLRVST